jgi:hypothetical protein
MLRFLFLSICVCVWVPVLLFLLPHDGVSRTQEFDARWRWRKRKQQTIRTPTIHRSSSGWLRYRYIRDIILFITVIWVTTIVWYILSSICYLMVKQGVNIYMFNSYVLLLIMKRTKRSLQKRKEMRNRHE